MRQLYCCYCGWVLGFGVFFKVFLGLGVVDKVLFVFVVINDGKYFFWGIVLYFKFFVGIFVFFLVYLERGRRFFRVLGGQEVGGKEDEGRKKFLIIIYMLIFRISGKRFFFWEIYFCRVFVRCYEVFFLYGVFQF